MCKKKKVRMYVVGGNCLFYNMHVCKTFYEFRKH